MPFAQVDNLEADSHALQYYIIIAAVAAAVAASEER
jgi:hypothetical protein